MAIITNANLQSILDKVARHCWFVKGDANLNSAPNALGAAPNVGLDVANSAVIGSLLTLIETTINDPFLDQYDAAAINILNAGNPVSAGFLAGIWGSFLKGLDDYCRSQGFKGLDDRLTALNGANGMTPTLRAHQAFALAFGLSRQNLFVGQNTDLATFAETGATTGTLTLLTPTGSGVAGQLPLFLAGAQLVEINTTALTAAPTITITAVKIDGTTVTLTVTPGALGNGAQNNLSDVSQLYIAVTAITITGGTSGNSFKITALADRRIDNA